MKFTNTNTTVLTTLILSLGAFSPLTFAQQAKVVDSKIGSTVTISGCLHAGEHSGQFVLVGVTEKTAAGQVAAVPYAIYWLDSSREMKPLVGDLVDVTGTVTKRDSRSGVIKIEMRSEEEQSTDVKVETETHKVTTKAYGGPSDKEAVVELMRPVYRVHVENVAPAENQNSRSACK